MNTGWGRSDAAYAAVEFVGSAGTRYIFPLLGNVNVRDWLHSNYTNSINGTTTIEVWTEGNARLDKQQFVLPPAFLTERLTSILFHDWGSPYSQSLYVVGVTALTTTAMPGRGAASLGGGCQGGGMQTIDGLFSLGMGLQFRLAGADPGATLAVLNLGAPGFGISCGPCAALPMLATWFPPLQNGSSNTTIQVPCLRSLVGASIGAQWVVFGTGSNPCSAFPGVATSDAALFMVGI
ncbi:MAG: hypothetical protein IPK26_22965 [Planctomycetes bacterium]|nr:hypothetical protein [Planctomycetota bacterium]